MIPRPLQRPPARPHTPALDLWTAELAAGGRTIGTRDALARAAGYEYGAIEPESEAALVPSIAESRLGRAREIIREAAKAQAAADDNTTPSTDYRALAERYATDRDRPSPAVTPRVGWSARPRKAVWG